MAGWGPACVAWPVGTLEAQLWNDFSAVIFCTNEDNDDANIQVEVADLSWLAK